MWGVQPHPGPRLNVRSAHRPLADGWQSRSGCEAPARSIGKEHGGRRSLGGHGGLTQTMHGEETSALAQGSSHSQRSRALGSCELCGSHARSLHTVPEPCCTAFWVQPCSSVQRRRVTLPHGPSCAHGCENLVKTDKTQPSPRVQHQAAFRFWEALHVPAAWSPHFVPRSGRLSDAESERRYMDPSLWWG